MTSLRTAPGLAAFGLVGALLLGGCSEQEAQEAVDTAADQASSAIDELGEVELPEVDWERYGQETKERIDSLAEQADCEQLEEMAQDEQNDTEVTAYIKAQIREVC